MYAVHAPDALTRIFGALREALSFAKSATAVEVGVRSAMADEDGAEALVWSRYDFMGH